MLFNEEISKKVHELTGKNVLVETIDKSDGTSYTGLLYEEEGKRVQPIFNLSDLTEADRADMDALAKNIVDTLNEAATKMPTDLEFNFEAIKNSLRVRLIHESNVPRYALSRPLLGDIVQILHIAFSIGRDKGYTLVKHSFLNEWNKTADELFDIAYDNTAKEQVRIENLGSMITALDPLSSSPPVPHKVVTRPDSWYGANVLVCYHAMKEASNGKTILIMPSSVHEIIVQEYDQESDDLECIRNMVREINENVLSKSDLLSNHVYLYDEEHGLRVAA